MKRAVTSASNIFRRKLCPGSARMEVPFAETDSEYSAEGTMLHKLFLTGQRPDTLTSEQVTTLDLADFYAGEFFAGLRRNFEIPDDAEYIDEREVGMSIPCGGGQLAGHADVIRTWPAFRVRGIVDAKFGFMEVEQAADNLQLACYAIMRQEVSRAKHLGVAIVQPRNFGPRLSMASYGADILPAVRAEIDGIVRWSEPPAAPLHAGDHCHFCKAKVSCPAYTAKFETLQTVEQTAIQTLGTHDLVTVFEVIRRAKKIDAEVTAEVRARIERGDFPGYKLANSGDDVTLNDALGFFEDLRWYGRTPDEIAQGAEPLITASEFDQCRSLAFGKLETLLAAKLKISADRAKKLIREVSAPHTTRTPKQQKIVRDKGAPRIDQGTTGVMMENAPES